MLKFRAIFYFVFPWYLWTCTLTDNQRPEVFYLQLANPKVKLPFSNGDDTHKITEIWVFANGQILGLFPLPAKIPIVFDGKEKEITILAGIKNNGMVDQPVFYPFYKSIDKTIKGNPGEIISFPIEFSYTENAKFTVYESFENNHCFLNDIDGKPKPEWMITSETYTTGLKSGVVTLTSTDGNIEMACTNFIKKNDIARGKSYLELDYKGSGEIAVGVLKFSSGAPKATYNLFIPARENWNKIYIELTDLTAVNDFNEYAILVSIRKTGDAPQSKVYLDNIKHIHF